MRKVSAASDEMVKPNDEPQAREYVGKRKALAQDLFTCVKRSKVTLDDSWSKNDITRKEHQDAYRVLDDLDVELSKERWSRFLLFSRILGHPSEARIGEAYLAAIAEYLPEPAGARVWKQKTRDDNDQAGFRNRLHTAYCGSLLDADPHNPMGWCPITKQPIFERRLRAAHIVPYAIGELNAAYLFGADVDRGYECMWSLRNGMMMHEDVEKAFDKGQLIIVPDINDSVHELKAIVLDDSIMRLQVDNGVTFGDIHNRRLDFKTDERPGRRNLYLHYLLTLFRRRRFNVEGWEQDLEKVAVGKIWGTPGRWMRRSIIQALATEIGDSPRFIDIATGGAGLADDFSGQLPAEKEAEISLEIRIGIEGLLGKSEVE